MKKRSNYVFIAFVCWLPVALWASPTDPYREVNLSWERFGAVYARIVDSYYASLDNQEIMQAAIEACSTSLIRIASFMMKRVCASCVRILRVSLQGWVLPLLSKTVTL